MVNATRQALNVMAVLLDSSKIRHVQVSFDIPRKPAKVVAFLVDKDGVAVLAEIFGHDLDCSVEADVLNGTVTIHNDLVYSSPFGLVVSTLSWLTYYSYCN